MRTESDNGPRQVPEQFHNPTEPINSVNRNAKKLPASINHDVMVLRTQGFTNPKISGQLEISLRSVERTVTKLLKSKQIEPRQAVSEPPRDWRTYDRQIKELRSEGQSLLQISKQLDIPFQTLRKHFRKFFRG